MTFAQSCTAVKTHRHVVFYRDKATTFVALCDVVGIKARSDTHTFRLKWFSFDNPLLAAGFFIILFAVSLAREFGMG